ncbi:hypothetical protein OIU34_27750 [Pararhizobium sp. BT-229]|uniref:hypothetical protein n=1 Tax=Pararhizobium sp. BT-229 TaxID=2986923 RepID=UPI0021F77151|nr:hypothetical protein [Pararhizobium sp. BT-229]MCV9965673.1 hypothetical protein [Pararhizobium sp. BT-229]
MPVPQYEFEKFVVFAPAICLTGSISAREIVFEPDAMLILENDGSGVDLEIDCDKMSLAGDTNTIASRYYSSLDGAHGNPGETGKSFAGDGEATGRPGGKGSPGADGEDGKVCNSINLKVTIKTIAELGTTKLRFDLTGPDGGNGGHGGGGGHGGHGQRGMPCELSDPNKQPVYCAIAQGPGGSGGDGGHGGSGGNAGGGGNGGSIIFVVSQQLAVDMKLAEEAGRLQFVLQGGDAGQPGLAGRGGQGGWEGPVGQTIDQCNLIWTVGPPLQARSGYDGRDGGHAGPGSSGTVTWQTMHV